MDHICCGAHGLSLLITGIAGGKRHTVLFDTGPEEEVFEHNAKRLKAPLGEIETIQLSHWHRDHSGGMLKVLSMANAARGEGAEPISVDLHPARPDFRGFMAMAPVSLEADPTFEEVEAAGGKVDKHDEAHEIAEGFFTVSGEIPRVTEYEKGIRRGLQFYKKTGKWESDELMKDERFLMCKLKGEPTACPKAMGKEGDTIYSILTSPANRQRPSNVHRLLPRRRGQRLAPRPRSRRRNASLRRHGRLPHGRRRAGLHQQDGCGPEGARSEAVADGPLHGLAREVRDSESDAWVHRAELCWQ